MLFCGLLLGFLRLFAGLFSLALLYVDHLLAVVDVLSVFLFHRVYDFLVAYHACVNRAKSAGSVRNRNHDLRGAGPVGPFCGKSALFGGKVVQYHVLVLSLEGVQILSVDGVVDRHKRGYGLRVGFAVRVGGRKVRGDDVAQVPDVVHFRVGSQNQDVRVKLFLDVWVNGVDYKILGLVSGACGLCGVAGDLLSKPASDALDRLKRVDAGVRTRVVFKFNCLAYRLQFVFVNRGCEKRGRQRERNGSQRDFFHYYAPSFIIYLKFQFCKFFVHISGLFLCGTWILRKAQGGQNLKALFVYRRPAHEAVKRIKGGAGFL